MGIHLLQSTDLEKQDLQVRLLEVHQRKKLSLCTQLQVILHVYVRQKGANVSALEGPPVITNIYMRMQIEQADCTGGSALVWQSHSNCSLLTPQPVRR